MPDTNTFKQYYEGGSYLPVAHLTHAQKEIFTQLLGIMCGVGDHHCWAGCLLTAMAAVTQKDAFVCMGELIAYFQLMGIKEFVDETGGIRLDQVLMHGLGAANMGLTRSGLGIRLGMVTIPEEERNVQAISIFEGLAKASSCALLPLVLDGYFDEPGVLTRDFHMVTITGVTPDITGKKALIVHDDALDTAFLLHQDPLEAYTIESLFSAQCPVKPAEEHLYVDYTLPMVVVSPG